MMILKHAVHLLVLILLLFMSVLLVCVSIIIRKFTNNYISRNEALNSSLYNNGYVLLTDIFSEQDIKTMKHHVDKENVSLLKSFMFRHDILKRKLDKQISLMTHSVSNYEYQDYILLLKRSQIHTCHRDYNGDLYHKLNHPSFTFIVYLNDMNSCLDIIENSHKSFRYLPYIFDPTKHVQCNIGDILLFNSNLLHAGSIINTTSINPRIQMKLCHKDDRKTLNFYEKYSKIINEDNNANIYRQNMGRYISCQSPYTAEIANTYVNGTNFKPPDWFMKLFYGNTKFFAN